MFIIGLAICLLGARLAFVGGTFYFVAMGLAMIIAAVLIARRRRSGIILYAIAFVASPVLGRRRCRLALLAAVLAPFHPRRFSVSLRYRLAIDARPFGQKARLSA